VLSLLIRKVPEKKFGPGINCPDRGLSGFFSLSEQMLIQGFVTGYGHLSYLTLQQNGTEKVLNKHKRL
jgi:hypothetical protein